MLRRVWALKNILLAVYLIINFVMACAPKKAVPSNKRIINGMTESLPKPLAKATVQLIYNDTSGDRQTLCTGTLVAANQVITASHCFKLLDPELVFVRLGFTDASGKEHLAEVGILKVSHYLDNVRDRAFPNFDVATIILNENVPAPFEPVPILPRIGTLAADQDLYMVGYGQNKKGCTGEKHCSGVKLYAMGRLVEYRQSLRDRSLVVVESVEDNQRVCHGDSGGPLYAETPDGFRVMGVLNGNAEAITGKFNGEGCQRSHIYSFAGSYGAFFESAGKNDLLQGRGPWQQVERMQVTPSFELADLCRYDNDQDPLYFSMDYIIRHVSRRAGNRDIVYDCQEFMAELKANPLVFMKDQVGLIERAMGLRWARVSDLRPFALLSNLEKLEITFSDIRDVSPLGKLAGLKELILVHNETLHDEGVVIKGWEKLKHLEKIDISHFQKLKMFAFEKHYRPLAIDLKELQALPHLKELKLSGLEVKNGALIKEFTKLEKLDFGLETIGISRPDVPDHLR